MSNQACLLAEDDPEPVHPEAEAGAAGETEFITEGVYRIPVFWLFCFDKGDLVTLTLADGGPLPTLVADMKKVRRRLAKRDRLARELFPEHVGIWEEWREEIEGVGRRYLKADLCEIQMMYEDANALGESLGRALGWFTSGDDRDREQLFALAGLTTYDPKQRTFTFDPDEECAEAFLI